MIKILKRFYYFIWRYRGTFTAFLVILVASTVAERFTPYFYKLFIDFAPLQNTKLLLRVLLVYAGVRVLATLLDALALYIGDKVLIPAARDARITIFRMVQDLDFAFHANKSTGSLISAFKRGDGAFFDLFHDLHFGVVRIFISLLVMIFFFSYVSVEIIFIILGLFTLNLIVGWGLIRINIRQRIAFNKEEDKISSIITDNLINYETVKLFAQEKSEENRLKKEFRPWTQKLWGYANSFRSIDIAIGALSNLGIFMVLWLVIGRLQTNKIGIGDLVMVSSFVTGFYYQFFDFMYRMRGLAKRYVDIKRYFGLLDNEILIKDPVRPFKKKAIEGKIGFEKVSFAYPNDKSKDEVLKEIDLAIEPGEAIAFVGRSGAGKTTLIKLLLRFYDVTRGKITIDDVNIKDFTKSQLRSFIGVVPQEPILFNNTIGYNIAYGRPRATQKTIDRAAKIANIYDFIQSLPDRYQTPVGERGIKLSGGQKQRLAIARMLLAKPQIIIFDEATSNLDSESERLIQDALWKIAKKKTMLIIAHRFATLRKADKIVVMNTGLITETGTHNELIKKKTGLYAYLWRLQAKGETSPTLRG